MFMYEYMNPEQIMLETMDRLCSPGTKGFKDLYIKPVSFAQLTQEVLRETYKWASHDTTTTHREYMI